MTRPLHLLVPAMTALATLVPAAATTATAGHGAQTGAARIVDVATDPPWRPLLWGPAPAIDPSVATEPPGIDDRIASHLIAIDHDLAEPLTAARDQARDARPRAPLTGFTAMLAKAKDPVTRGLLATLAGRARLSLSAADAKSAERDAYDLARTASQARLVLASAGADLDCALALVAGRAAARAGLVSDALAAYRSAPCADAFERAHAHLAQGLLLVTLARKGDAETLLTNADVATLPDPDQALGLAALGDLELARGETTRAAERYREAARKAPSPAMPPLVAIRLAEAARLDADVAQALHALKEARSEALRAARGEALTSWLTLRIATVELAAGQIGAARTELGGAGDSAAADLRRLDTRQAFAAGGRASSDLATLAADYRALARRAHDPRVTEEATFKAAWLTFKAGDAGAARDAFASFRDLYAESKLAAAAGHGLDLALEDVAAELAHDDDALALARVVARDRELLSTSAAGPRLWMLAGWALESLGLDREAEALYRRTRARLAASERACAQRIDASLAAIALRRGDLPAARAALGQDAGPATLDVLAAWHPSPMPEQGCAANLLASLARDPELAVAAARNALARDDCDAARAHLEPLGDERPEGTALTLAELARRCDTGSRAVALASSTSKDGALSGEALAIALLATDRFPEPSDAEPIPVAPASAGVWAAWARTRAADRVLAAELARARMLP